MARLLAANVAVTLAAAQRLRLNYRAACRGLSFAEPEDLRGRRWVPWSEAANFSDRLILPLSDSVTEHLGAEYARSHPLAQAFGSAFLDSRRFMSAYLIATKAAAASYASVQSSIGETRIDLACRLKPGLGAAGAGVFRVSGYAVAHACAAVGLPPLEIEKFDWTPTRLDLVLRLPAAKHRNYTGLGIADVVDGLRTLRNAMMGLSDAGNPDLREVQDGLPLQRALSLTRGELRVATRLADGLTPREASAGLGIAYETVRTHLRRIYAKLEVANQRELADLVNHTRDRLKDEGR